MPEQESAVNEANTSTVDVGPQNTEAAKASKILDELMYCFASFHAIVGPVSITMILSALAVVYINTDETRAQGEAAFSSTYEVIELDEGNSSQNFAASVANTLIIVSVICAMTFVVVLLYKYRCTKIFMGYMVVVTALLLGYFTSTMLIIAIEKYNLGIDKLSFAYVMWNYAVVGTAAIFYPVGIPLWVSQGYLIGSSIVLAWQLSYFNEWTAWTLLVVLALYDLFAVLTPCGPLKYLAQLMSRHDAPALPGLLYEAPLPNNVHRPNRAARDLSAQNQQEGNATPASSGSEVPLPHEPAANQPDHDYVGSSSLHLSSNQRERLPNDETTRSSSFHLNSPLPDVSIQIQQNENATASTPPSPARSGSAWVNFDGAVEIFVPESDASHNERTTSQESTDTTLLQGQAPNPNVGEQESYQDIESLPQGKVPLAIAKMYKLRVIDEEGVLRKRGEPAGRREFSAEEIRSIEWTPKQLRSDVTVEFPSRGGRIEKSEDDGNLSQGPQYLVYNRRGELLRTFVVNKQGRVMQVVKRERSDKPEDNSIKLGLVGGAF
jgi:presenilin 1